MSDEGTTLGEAIKLIRKARKWTLREMSAKVGIPLSTLGKVETNRLSLSYDKLQQFASHLDMSITEVLGYQGQGSAPPLSLPRNVAPIVTGRRSIGSNSTTMTIGTANYDYRYLCTELLNKRMVPIISRVIAKSVADFGELVEHEGEEFVYVISGTVEVHMRFYAPHTLEAGEYIYLDSSMGHAYTVKDCDESVILCVCSSDRPNLFEELKTLARDR